MAGGGHDAGELAREGQIECGARGGIAGTPIDFHDFWFREPGGGVGRLANDRVALCFQMTLDERFDGFGRFVWNQTEINRRARFGRDRVRRLGADMPRFNSAQVQPRLHEQFVERFSAAFGRANLKFAAKIGLDVWDFRDGFRFSSRRRADVVVEAFDQNPAVLVPHRIEQMGEANNWVRHPIPVVAVVQAFDGTVNGKIETKRAARAEDELHPPALMHGAIAKNPGVRADGVREFFQVIGQMR